MSFRFMKYTIYMFAILFWNFMEGKEIAITFDDSPRFAKGHFDGPTRARLLIENLKKAGVKEAAFFSVSSNLDDEGKKRLETYSQAGHIIANHTHTHPDYNQSSSSEYVQNFRTAHELLSSFRNFEKWFRFPYLREGDSIEKRDAMRKALRDLGYINAYVTVNNYDWYMEGQFQEAILAQPKLDLQKFKSYYVKVLIEAVEYYDEMAIRHLGRSPKHVLLLHETDTNALFIADFVEAIRLKGWKIISPREAYTDPILSHQTNLVLKRNPGRIGEIAKGKGQTDGLWHESCSEEYLDKKFQELVLANTP